MLCCTFLQKMIDPEGFCKLIPFRLVSLSINGDTNIYVYMQKPVESTWHLVGAHYTVIIYQGSPETKGCHGRRDPRPPISI